MSITSLRRLVPPTVVAIGVFALVLSTPVFVHAQPQTKISGLIHHYTVNLDGAGPWQIVGDWSLTLNSATGKVDLLAALSMVRSDNPSRGAHTHHVGVIGGDVTVLSNGYRITGTAILTSNGSTAPFSGSPATIEVTGGNTLALANFRVAFGGAAAAHFGTEPLLGVVSVSR